MASIINGLFAARSGIASHGTAIAVVSDNISNASTIGYKASRAEFEDLINGGQTTGRVVGSGSSTSAVSTIFEQGTLEFTSRPLDLAVDGNGFFTLADGAQRFYTRAGNFKVNAAGFIVNPNGLSVLGFSSNGSGALEPLNANSIEQNSVATTSVGISGNLDASSAIIDATDIPTVSLVGATASTTTYADLAEQASFSTSVNVFDSLGSKHAVTFYFFHTGSNTWNVRGYVNSEDVDGSGSATGLPRQLGSAAGVNISFTGAGARVTTPTAASPDIDNAAIAWNNGSSASSLDFLFTPMTQYSANSNILSITQDGEGVGTVTSLSIGKDGRISALLDNGQTATIGTIGLANFSNPEGLARVGKNMLQQTPDSGEPIVGTPQSGTLGAINSGSIELSTVDIANEFVKLITLQRNFQGNTRIINVIGQLLSEIVQLA